MTFFCAATFVFSFVFCLPFACASCCWSLASVLVCATRYFVHASLVAPFFVHGVGATTAAFAVVVVVGAATTPVGVHVCVPPVHVAPAEMKFLTARADSFGVGEVGE